MSERYFFDTYALFEILKGNPAYKLYKKILPIITIFNLAEFNYNLKKDYKSKEANEVTAEYSAYCVKVELEDIYEATEAKKKNKQLSIPDVIGYAVAQRLNIKFLTGDKEFKDLPNVEFIK